MEQAVQEVDALSETEQARRDFIHQARKIADISIQTRHNNTLAEQSILIIVPDILGSAADQVSALEVRIRRQYRHARLNIEFEVAETSNEAANNP